MQLTFPTVSVVSSALFPRTLSQKVFSLVKIQNPTPLPFVIFMAINLKLGFISKKANVTFTHLYRQICWCCSTTVLLRWTFLAAPIARLLTQNNAVVSSLQKQQQQMKSFYKISDQDFVPVFKTETIYSFMEHKDCNIHKEIFFNGVYKKCCIVKSGVCAQLYATRVRRKNH